MSTFIDRHKRFSLFFGEKFWGILVQTLSSRRNSVNWSNTINFTSCCVDQIDVYYTSILHPTVWCSCYQMSTYSGLERSKNGCSWIPQTWFRYWFCKALKTRQEGSKELCCSDWGEALRIENSSFSGKAIENVVRPKPLYSMGFCIILSQLATSQGKYIYCPL